MMKKTESTPSVRMTIWCNGSVHYAHTQVNANPHDEKLRYLKKMSFFNRLLKPWLNVYNKNDNKSYLIRKSSIVIMEFQWDKEEDD